MTTTASAQSLLRHTEFFDVIAHTNDVLVVQTHVGVPHNQDKLHDMMPNHDYHYSNSQDANLASQLTSFGYFNLGLHVNDANKMVLANRNMLLRTLNIYLTQTQQAKHTGVDSIYWLNQVHGNDVIDLNHTEHAKLSLIAPDADAMLTHSPNTALAIMTADCVPIVLFDKSSGAVAAIHAGWQGLAKGVISQTCATLQSKRAINAQRTHSLKGTQAWIGACISQPCYEVSQDVVDKLLAGCAKIGMNVEQIKKQIIAKHHDQDKAWIDLPALAALQLSQQGVKVQSYDTGKFAYACSYDDKKYYSYRRMTHQKLINTGRMATVIIRL